MKDFWVSFFFLLPSLVMLTPISIAQLTPSETRILLQVKALLEYPQALQGWTNWTNFCYLPPSPSLNIVCSNGHVTQLTIVGNKSSSLSNTFSIHTFFTVLTKLSNLKLLSLVSLGLWGPLPSEIDRFWSLQVLNLSSNSLHGEIPSSISSLKNLKTLSLSDNLFNGSVPDIKSLTFLEDLNLGNNNLGPKFPSLGNKLVSIILKNNSLKSQLPSKFVSFNKLQQLDISCNEFAGPIPPSLFSLPSIQYLNLSRNQFSGSLSAPTSCSNKLSFLDISHNLLTGKLPSCIGSKPSSRRVVYSWNCLSSVDLQYQHPYEYCQRQALAVKPPIKGHEKESSLKLGLVLGIIGGVLGIAGLLVVLILVIVSKSKGERANGNKFEGPIIADKLSVLSSPRPNTDPRTMRLAALGLPPYQIFTLEEIEDATNNFDSSNLIGNGSQGQLYKGWIREGSMVLVNCVKLKQKSLPQSLMQQMDVLPKLRHRHLVSVFGHCIVTYQDHPNTGGSTVFIVLEHISNGSLREHLNDWRKKEMLKWPQRMAITMGIARGIQFLHTGIAPGIFGNNIKIENVLLDGSLNAKISGYNITLLSKKRMESPCDEQKASYHVDSTEKAEKEDIYHFGVILVEVITGKQVGSASELEDLKLQLESGLSEAPSVLRIATDPSIRGTFAHESLRTTIQIAVDCLSKDWTQRPSIEDVLWNLQYSIQVQEGWTSSGSLSTKL